MKNCLMIIVLIIVCSFVQGQAFKKESAMPAESVILDDQFIDDTYVLYVKSICKKKVKQVVVPCNCKVLGRVDEKDIVENEYLFISQVHKKGVVINYIKDRNQKFYVKTKTRKLRSLFEPDTVKVNIWYFNQLRFGNYYDSSNTLIFQEYDSPSDIHLWKLEKDADSIVIYSVSTELPDGYEEKLTGSSLALRPVFYKVNNYKIIFQEPYYRSTPVPEYELPQNKLSVDLKNGCVYFAFDKPVAGSSNILVFKRLYSYFPPGNKDKTIQQMRSK